MFIVGQAFYLLNCRSLTRSMWSVGWFSNPWIWVGIGAMLVLQLAFTYLPFMNTTLAVTRYAMPTKYCPSPSSTMRTRRS